jgi:hypothetical protein
VALLFHFYKLSFSHQLIVEASKVTIAVVFKDQLAGTARLQSMEQYTRTESALEILQGRFGIRIDAS